MRIYHKLSHFLNVLFIRDVCIFFKEETVNIQLLLMLEDIRNNRRKRNKDYREIEMEDNTLIASDGSSDIPATIRMLKNDYNLKIEFLKMGKIKLKILDYKENPFYLRIFNPSSIEEEVLINISGWDKGIYEILLTTLLGATLVSGKFEIY